MLDRVRNHIIPNGYESRLTRRLSQLAAAISNRVDALDGRVEKLESAVVANLGAAACRPTAVRRRKTNRRHPGYTAAAGPLSAVELGNALKADARHCQDLIRRTKAVLRCCLAAL
jgi:hypothetical protein